MASYPNLLVAFVTTRRTVMAFFLLMSVVLTGCEQTHEEQAATEDIAVPPNRTATSSWMAQERELPAWAYSAACDQPRARSDDDGLVRTDPVIGKHDVVVYVPGIEDVLCNINGVLSASVAGTYAGDESARSGSVDIDVLMSVESTEETLRAVRQAASTAADQQGLTSGGIEIGAMTFYLTDGSFVSAPGRGNASGGDITLMGSGIRALEQLRTSGHGDYWSVDVARGLTLTTYIVGNPTHSDVVRDVQEALESSAGVQAPAMSAPRADVVVLNHDALTLTYTANDQGILTGVLVEDLHALSQTDGVEAVVAQINVDSQGQEVLEVQIEPSTPGVRPDIETISDSLESAAGLRGLQVIHTVAGVPSDES